MAAHLFAISVCRKVKKGIFRGEHSLTKDDSFFYSPSIFYLKEDIQGGYELGHSIPYFVNR